MSNCILKLSPFNPLFLLSLHLRLPPPSSSPLLHAPQALSGELSPFMCSGGHVPQMDCHPSAVGCFLEGVVRCNPQPSIRSCILKVSQ